MLAFLLSRLARMPLIAFGVVTIVFFIFKAVPGDEAMMMAGATASQADIDLLRTRLGLDRPILEQYATRMLGLVTGDFGYSSTFRGNPLPHILTRLPATLALAASAILVTIVIGIPAGVIAAARQGGAVDLAISTLVVALLAIPNFWLGLILIVVLSVELGLLPSFGFGSWAALVMPTAALSARLIALVARMTRGVVIEELAKDYVRTARAKGVAGPVIVVRHVLRNALIPVVTVIGLQTGYLLGGSVVVERLFAWPGLGDLMVNAIGARDFTLVQAITVIFVLGFLAITLVVELLYAAINPRLRRG
jgi:ABC-type dipeptide/oligopeptide/nickel transport system permease component